MAGEVVLFEAANEKRIAQVLGSNLAIWAERSGRSAEDTKKQLKAYLNAKAGRNRFRVVYDFGQGDNDGRLYAAQSMEARGGKRRKTCSGLQHLPSDVRNFISGTLCHDLDMVNALPTVVGFLFEQQSMTSHVLTEYLANRGACLERWRMGKQDVIKVITNGRVPPIDDTPSDVMALHSDVHQRLLPVLRAQNQTMWKQILASRKVELRGNPAGSFISKMAFLVESRVLDVARRVVHEQGYEVFSLIFDGMLVGRRAGPLPATLIPSIQNAVKAEIGVSIKFLEKPMVPSAIFMDAITASEFQLDLAGYIRSLPGYENFNVKRLTAPSLENLAEWFLELRGGAVLKHPSGTLFILGEDNIWQQEDSIRSTSLNIQISRTIKAGLEVIERLFYEHEYDVEELESAIEVITTRLENRASCDVADNVARLCPKSPAVTGLFLSKPNLLAFSDCVYDIDTRQTRAIAPDDYILFHTGYPFPRVPNPEIRARIRAFYESIFRTKELAEFRLSLVASCLWGELVNEMFMVLQGESRNGKGTEDALIETALGGYYRTLHKNNLTLESIEPDKANSGLFSLFGGRYISTSEPGARDKFQNAVIKPLSGGDSPPVRDLRGKTMPFRHIGLLNIQTNNPPVFVQLESAVEARCHVLEYPFRFKAEPNEAAGIKLIDTTIKTTFRTKAYRDEFMLLLIDTYHAHFSVTKDITFPDEVIYFSQKSLKESFTGKLWFDEFYELTGDTEDVVVKPSVGVKYEQTHTEDRHGKKLGRTTLYKELETFLRSGQKRIGDATPVVFFGMREKFATADNDQLL